MIYGKIIERKTKFSMNVEFTFLFNPKVLIKTLVIAKESVVVYYYRCE